MIDSWNPEQYEKFKNERSQPFLDLIALVEARERACFIDLGCGTGQLTRLFHDSFRFERGRGVDNSANMIGKAQTQSTSTLEFQMEDLTTFLAPNSYDVILSNAAIQWCSDHPKIFSNIRQSLKSGGQIAVQMPMNHDYPSHVVAARVAQGERFAKYLDATETQSKTSSMLKPEDYATLLFALGFKRQKVFVNVYAHVLESRDGVIEWVKGTMLTHYQTRMPPAVFQEFLTEYRRELFTELADTRPFFYPFKRILIWASLS
ncbi:MAG: methyltransferase domain-containing protein [Bdellovibrionota bacterium]